MGRRLPAAVALLLAALTLPACHETVTHPTLTATCDAQPTSGMAPLTVAFAVAVAGASGPFTVAVSYGDGTSGSNPDQPHTYQSAGSYSASFTVTTSSQSARCAATVTVASPPPPTTVADLPPDAVFKTTPAATGSRITGKAPLTVRFNMCASSDPEGDILYFLMDFDGDGKWDFGGVTGFHCRQDHIYATVGTWAPQMCVHDVDANHEALHDDECQTYVVEATP
jgi:PKD repeat protein